MRLLSRRFIAGLGIVVFGRTLLRHAYTFKQAMQQLGMVNKARVVGYGYVIGLAAFVAAAAWKL
jgi:hypothetical protein